MQVACQVERMRSSPEVDEYVAAIDVTLPSYLVTQEVIALCEQMELRFVLRDGSMQVLLPTEPASREALYASLDNRRIEYTLPLFGG
jgi:hypothetical protein